MRNMSSVDFCYDTIEIFDFSDKNDAWKNPFAESKVYISFKQHNFITLNRLETSSISDFIASCGGLLGLFMGVSLLSTIKKIFNSSFRLCCKSKQRRIQPNSQNVDA